MKTARFRDAQIMSILKQTEGGVPVSELCNEYGMSSALAHLPKNRPPASAGQYSHVAI